MDLKKAFPKQYNFFPKTWNLPSDKMDFKKEMRVSRLPSPPWMTLIEKCQEEEVQQVLHCQAFIRLSRKGHLSSQDSIRSTYLGNGSVVCDIEIHCQSIPHRWPEIRLQALCPHHILLSSEDLPIQWWAGQVQYRAISATGPVKLRWHLHASDQLLHK